MLTRTCSGWWLVLLLVLTGCRAAQPVVCKYHGPLKEERGGRVTVEATCAIPEKSLSFLRQDIQEYVSRTLIGETMDPSAYRVDVVITRYDEGNMAFRLLTFGMAGRIRLEGSVYVREGNPPENIGEGYFDKWFGTIMPFPNLFASMERTLTPKVGLAVSRALKKSTKKE